MLELAIKGNSRYFAWLGFLLVIMGIGGATYVYQLQEGMGMTGMGRSVSWGFYIAQFTYLVGVAAAAVMLVLPYYFHNYKGFKELIIMAEFQAIAAVMMCLGFIIVDIGQPQRMLNVILYPTPNSMLFWDMTVLNGYLFINLLVGWVTLQSARNNATPPQWIKFFIILSVVWAFSIHTVTAFLYQGLPGRHLWLHAILAARFLASAFCAGPSILLLVMFLLKKVTGGSFGPKPEAVKTLSQIICYAMIANLFFFGLELFTGFYSNIPGHMHNIEFLFGFHHFSWVAPVMWASVVFGLTSVVLLVIPATRNNFKLLPFTLIMLVLATWMDKGIGLLVGGFTPDTLERVDLYVPTVPELLISLSIFAMGAFVLTILYKIALEVKKETGEIS